VANANRKKEGIFYTPLSTLDERGKIRKKRELPATLWVFEQAKKKRKDEPFT